MDRVTFVNKGNTVVGNLFKPAGFEQGTKYPAVVVTHPFGAVKEQVPTTYAKLLAEQGFVTLVFDASYQGESGGEPHFSEFPAVRVEDIRCAVDFLSNHADVDPERIGALGVCAGGGYTVNVAQTELRIKAVAGVSTFNIGSARRDGVGPLGAQSAEYRTDLLTRSAQARTREAAGGEVELFSLIADNPKFDMNDLSTIPAMYLEGYKYYSEIDPNPRFMGTFALSSLSQQMAFFPFEGIELISPRPLLLIAGSEADTLYMSQDAIERAKEPKELFVLDEASHIDLYWNPKYVPQVAEKLTEFFGKHL
ncbi:alpha/beta hydrolase [Streptomyces sp. MBT62]|uniref:alpha/beta hydrolase n=1 Tax=Streptomyces sp. MBT62 TaxID=2800410 RepID=UPI00190B4492|nr:alpha/beta hydrolase [Streptomyces sp. MBT62]MBK3565726.1 alpha/beta hydrolase [Streptomyces sp. MBT62]